MSDWMDDFRKELKDVKINAEIEMKNFRAQIKSGIFSEEQKKMIGKSVKTLMTIQFREIDAVIDYIDASDIEALSALMELIQYLKKLEFELDELLGE